MVPNEAVNASVTNAVSREEALVRDIRPRPARSQQFPALPQTSRMTWQLLYLQVPTLLLNKTGEDVSLPYQTVQLAR